MPADEKASGLTSFALAVYAEDGVSAACLTLQDRLGVDVNLVLFAAYLGAVRAETLSDGGLAAARQRVGDWHRDVVRPLREVRRRLVEHPAAAQLRGDVKQSELAAEMIELGELGALADEGTRPAAPGSPIERAAAAILVVVSSDGAIDGDLRSAVEVVAAAAARHRC